MSARFGRYELLRPLGRGGMAEVFLARLTGPGGFEKRLVIKKVLPQLADDRQLLRMFFDEATTHVTLSHGNLVSVFDFGRVGNDYFIAMEYIDGADLGVLLSDRRRSEHALPPALVAYLGIEVCRGLSYVHRRGFIHRDISPRNVLLSVDGEVKLSDFGLVLSQSSAVSGIRGTLAYIAPEQARGERVDGRSDLYSLGVLLGEAATGRRLRESADQVGALELARDPAPVEIDGPLGAIVARATQGKADDRYADADAMLAALEQLSVTLGQGRETSVRAIATEVQRLSPTTPVPPAAAASEALETAGTQPPPTADYRGQQLRETYFRDQPTREFVDEVLETPTALPSPTTIVQTTVATPRSRAPLVVAVLLGAGAITGALLFRHAPTQVASAPDLGHAVLDAALAVVTPAPPSRPDREPAHVVQPATIVLRCTPWCVPIIDGKNRGSDGRSHRIVVAAGTHHVVAERLDDKLQRTVQLKEGETKTLTLDFNGKFD